MTLHNIIIPGFQFSGIHCGIKDDPKKKDLTLIYSENPKTLVDGVFTTNKVFAAPVTVCREVVKKGFGQMVVINSGVANACTGSIGLKNAYQTQKEAARIFGMDASRVLVCSTGKIGDKLPMKKLIKGLGKSTQHLGPGNFVVAAKGIMTTDEYPKYAWVKGEIGGKKYVIGVMAKGAGMLCPNMATMLAYVITNLNFTQATLRTIFRRAVGQTLNRITVDGDTSTNDTVLVMANGLAGNKTFTADSAAGRKVEKQMTELLDEMARKITLDGEGATKCTKVFINGAKTVAEARKIAYSIGNSPLVKTALFGCDPNWGRIMAAVGYSGAHVVQEKLKVSIGPHMVVKNGQGVIGPSDNFKALQNYMKKQDLEITVDVGVGKASFFVYMSDLTYDYINLNAEYHT
ncbi:bifunctional glutamate N-acetyltransferase/amino-acid acetyltransferase ArgJ [bacterium]|nr:bifunctional glutamate N-acetyltransferase/amino-acid acetyltransferase ArgJ [bacterium]